MIKRKKFDLFWKFSLYFSVSFLIFLFLFWSRIIFKEKATIGEEKKKLENELNLLKEKNSQLKSRLEQMNDEKYLEEKARENGFQKENEEIIIIKKEI
ncbi:MAG: septum formation initiator family protein [Minisyncoccales bacterium]